MVVKVVVECALVLKKKKEDDCDEINCRRRLSFFAQFFFSEIASRESKRTKKDGCVENMYKRFDFRQVMTNK